MIITNEEDQLRFEQHLRETFLKGTADFGGGCTTLYEHFSQTEKTAIASLFRLDVEERPLLVCMRLAEPSALVTNQRLTWQDLDFNLQSLNWSSIATIKRGTAEQQNKIMALKSREEKIAERLKMTCIEVTDSLNRIHIIELEAGNTLECICQCINSLHWTYHLQRRGQRDLDAYVAHKYSSRHRTQVLQSELCGCFFCLHTFPPSEVRKWIDRDDTGIGTTAMCPECDIDSIIAAKSGYPITKEFLERMRSFWFGSLYVKSSAQL